MAEHYADDEDDPLSKALEEEFVRSHGSDEATVERLWRLAESQTQACREVLRKRNGASSCMKIWRTPELIVSALLEEFGQDLFR